ncbi:MAG: CDP-glucose 4,6-dehydratase [Geminicoccaceae bacterium]|nr:CDP-glucose 4,6-dehydratase [Geminicoccaceae bacterium]MCB9944751.1 CDP-glucose 4,6-dehydratase [Geminicoccaceae bacterium]
MIDVNRTFWLNRRVLVTGHTGFKGTWLSAWLADLGADLIGFGLRPTVQGTLHRSAGLQGRMDTIEADIRDRDTLEQAIASREPEIIFHLAGQPLVLAALKNPVDTFDINTIGTLNLLQAARRSRRLRAIVVVTSDKCYEPRKEACREGHQLGGIDPYSASKACADIIASSYRRCFLTPEDGIGLATARAGNVIGGGDFSHNRLLPDLVRAARSGQPVILRNPDAVRPWQHVLDALQGYLMLAEAAATDPASYSGPWNFGPSERNECWPVRQVAEYVTAVLGGSVDIRPRQDSLESPVVRLNGEKARRQLDWTPRLDTGSAIRLAIDGYRRLLDEPQSDWLIEQIRHYESLDGTLVDLPAASIAASSVADISGTGASYAIKPS